MKGMNMNIKTSELQGAALDWAVMKCEGFDMTGSPEFYKVPYSSDWAQGGPIIERARINIEPFEDIGGKQWCSNGQWESPTPLIAAMRCYVASKLGDEVDIPEELIS